MPEQASSSADQDDVRLRIPELAGRARTRRLLAVLALLALVGGGLAYYLRPKPPEEVFRTFPVVRKTLVQLVEAAGRVDARSRVDVSTPVAGRITALHAVEGQLVKAGELLADLDARASALAVRGAQASASAAAGRLSQARAQLAEAERSLERARTLFDRDLASREDVSNAEFARAKAQASLQAAQGEASVAGESVASAQLEKNMSRIEAPADGVILRAPDRVGAVVSPEAGPVFVIGEPLTTVRIDASVSETDVARVKVGAAAQVEVDAVPGRVYNGRVERVGIDANRVEGAVLYPVVLSVDNPDRTLLPGMTARVKMEVARAENVLAVHEASLRYTPTGADPASPRSRVWKRMGPAEVEPVSVRTSVSDGVYTQVDLAEGAQLKEGDALAVGLLHPESSNAPRVTLGGK
ncbi:MAG: efflux RND transporter periplasmic adaptor subunit [Myxococcales bacterium]